MFYTIYKITNIINQKEYIGKHETTNMDDGYMGSGELLHRAIKKHGLDNFKKEILHIFDNRTDMDLKEQELVNEEYCLRTDTYNLSLGGIGGFWHKTASDAGKKGQRKTDEIMAEKFGPNWRSIQAKNGILKKYPNHMHNMNKKSREKYPEGTFKNHKHTDEVKKQISKSMQGKQSGSKNSQYNTCWITNGLINKKIPKKELALWLKAGYSKGRIIAPKAFSG